MGHRVAHVATPPGPHFCPKLLATDNFWKIVVAFSREPNGNSTKLQWTVTGPRPHRDLVYVRGSLNKTKRNE